MLLKRILRNYTIITKFDNADPLRAYIYHSVLDIKCALETFCNGELRVRQILRVFQMEAKVLMVHLLRTFHVTLAQDYKLELEQAITMHPKGGVPAL